MAPVSPFQKIDLVEIGQLNEAVLCKNRVLMSQQVCINGNQRCNQCGCPTFSSDIINLFSFILSMKNIIYEWNKSADFEILTDISEALQER